MMGKVRWSELWKKYKFVLLVVLVGVVLMLLPVSSKTKEPAAETRTSEESFDLEAEERRMEELLGRIDGVGKLRLMLTLQSGIIRFSRARWWGVRAPTAAPFVWPSRKPCRR